MVVDCVFSLNNSKTKFALTSVDNHFFFLNIYEDTLKARVKILLYLFFEALSTSLSIIEYRGTISAEVFSLKGRNGRVIHFWQNLDKHCVVSCIPIKTYFSKKIAPLGDKLTNSASLGLLNLLTLKLVLRLTFSA